MRARWQESSRRRKDFAFSLPRFQSGNPRTRPTISVAPSLIVACISAAFRGYPRDGAEMAQVLWSPEEGRRENFRDMQTHALISVKAASFHNQCLVMGLSRRILRWRRPQVELVLGGYSVCYRGKGAQSEATISTIWSGSETVQVMYARGRLARLGLVQLRPPGKRGSYELS